MAENISETRPPEPPPRPPEVPKPTEQPNDSAAPDGRVPESPQSAQQEARDAAQSEYARATDNEDQDGQRPTPESPTHPGEHSATKNDPEGPRAAPDFQEQLGEHSATRNDQEGPQSTPDAGERLDEHAAAKTDRDASAPQDATAGSRNVAALAGEQAAEHDAARRSAAAERAKATEGTDPPEPPFTADANRPEADAEAPGNPPDPAPEIAATAKDTGDLTPAGDGSGPWSDEGTNHREGGAVQQMTEGSCVSASGEMLTEGRVSQPELLSELGEWSNLSALRDELNNRDGAGTWTGHYFEDGDQALRRASEGPMAAQVQAPFGRAHMVILEPDENGSFTVRDPYEGSSYDVDSSWVEKYVAGGVFR